MTPTAEIRWLMARTHVATPYPDVAADVWERATGYNPHLAHDRPLMARQVTMALIQHRRNRNEYAEITRGHRP